MDKKCPLYGLQSKKQLKRILNISDNRYLKNHFENEINIFVDTSNKPRLIEAPSQELKQIQGAIKNNLQKCDIPKYVFSGVKDRSYYNNAEIHKECKYMFKADISAFFPNISRNRVYEFYKNDLSLSSDVACILTDLCTVNISEAQKNNSLVNDIVITKKIKQMIHLCTGSPASPLISYLANRKMFDDLYQIAKKNNYSFSIYVDDVFFGSINPIPNHVQSKIVKTITKYGYNTSEKKVMYYTEKEYKKVTGVVISPNNKLVVPNKLKKKIVDNFSNGSYKVSFQSMQGMVFAARIIEKDTFPNIQKHIELFKHNYDSGDVE